MAEGEFWGGDFGEIDEQPNEVATARAERIAAARKAATQYQAKVEEPQVRELRTAELSRSVPS